MQSKLEIKSEEDFTNQLNSLPATTDKIDWIKSQNVNMKILHVAFINAN